MDYQKYNQETIDRWIDEGWVWGKPISKEQFNNAKNGIFDILLTPTKPMPHEWIKDIKGKKVLGLASGGSQQIPILTALGAKCSVIDNSKKQIESEIKFAEEEGYTVDAVVGDITKDLPYDDESFDYIINPVSLCYIEDTFHVFKECSRVLKKGGILICGFDNGFNYLFDELDESKIISYLPFNPLKNKDQLELLEKCDAGIQFSHTFEELIGGQLKNGFELQDIYEDINDEGLLKEANVPTFIATKSIKK